MSATLKYHRAVFNWSFFLPIALAWVHEAEDSAPGAAALTEGEAEAATGAEVPEEEASAEAGTLRPEVVDSSTLRPVTIHAQSTILVSMNDSQKKKKKVIVILYKKYRRISSYIVLLTHIYS